MSFHKHLDSIYCKTLYFFTAGFLLILMPQISACNSCNVLRTEASLRVQSVLRQFRGPGPNLLRQGPFERN